MSIREIAPGEIEPLVQVWRRSVRATHRFLTEDDIRSLEPLVREQVLPKLETWVLCTDAGEPIGFMVLSGPSLEGLFIDPDHIGRGGGKLMLAHARKLKGPLMVDVNEQNPAALGFYLANGFEIVGRSPTDTAGRPFPLLHLKEIAPRGADPFR